MLVTFADSAQTRTAWDGGNRWKVISLEHATEAVSAQVDPDRCCCSTQTSRTTATRAQPQGPGAATKWAPVDGMAAGSAAHVEPSSRALRAQGSRLQAWLDGIRRVNKAPTILGCVFIVTLLTALPFSLVLRESLRAHLGNSLAADEALRGVNYQWWSEYSAAQPAGSIARTFGTSVIGFAVVMDNMSTLLDGGARPSASSSWVPHCFSGCFWRAERDRTRAIAPRERHSSSPPAESASADSSASHRSSASRCVLFHSVRNAFDDLCRPDPQPRGGATAFSGAWALVFGLLLVAVNVVFD